jgi:hypothetical protein
MKAPQQRNKGGRPRQRAPVAGERVSLGLRVTAELKLRLDSAAAAAGRSQSQEAELRLEQSFERQALLPQILDLAYGRKAAGLLLAVLYQTVRDGRIGAAQSGGSFEALNNWPDDFFACQQAARGAAAMFKGMQPPPGTASLVSNPADPMWQDQVDAHAAITHAAIKNPAWGEESRDQPAPPFTADQRNRELQEVATQIRERVGPEMTARIKVVEGAGA